MKKFKRRIVCYSTNTFLKKPKILQKIQIEEKNFLANITQKETKPLPVSSPHFNALNFN
jgi:hypothetical protein